MEIIITREGRNPWRWAIMDGETQIAAGCRQFRLGALYSAQRFVKQVLQEPYMRNGKARYVYK
jgi:hypothetical protein